MHNVLILGSGRSGTSMLGGTLAKAGYFMGDHLYPARDSNPKGFFEDEEINAINEDLLDSVVKKRPGGLLRRFFMHRPRRNQRWLAQVPLGTEIPCPDNIAERIKAQTNREPYCFKDPRFSYTLPAWRTYLHDTAYICVFRHPAETAASILKECAEEKYLRDLSINFSTALKVWSLMYGHIVETHRHTGDWLFLHYAQLFTEQGLDKLEEFTDAEVDRTFPESQYHRSKPERNVPEKCLLIYQRLCQLAGF